MVDTLTRLVDRSLVSVDGAEDGRVRYRLLDSIRAYAGERLRRRRAGRRPPIAPTPSGTRRPPDWCDGQHPGPAANPRAWPSRAPSAPNVDAALAWCTQQRPDLGVRIATGFGWTWVVLGDGPAAAARIRGALDPPRAPDQRAAALLLAGWLEASAGDVALAQSDLDDAAAIADQLASEVLQADVARHRAFLPLQQGLPAGGARPGPRRPGDVPSRWRSPWETAASLVLAAYGELMLGDTAAAARDGAEAVEILTPMGDSWGLVHAMAMLGGIAQVEHRFADAIEALSSCRAGVRGPRLPRTGGPPPGVAGPRAAASRRPREADGLVRAGPRCRHGQRRRPDGRDRPAQPRPAAQDASATERRPCPC